MAAVLLYLVPLLLVEGAISYAMASLRPQDFLTLHQRWRQQGRFRVDILAVELLLSVGAILLLNSSRMGHPVFLAALVIYVVAGSEIGLSLGSLLAAGEARRRLGTEPPSLPEPPTAAPEPNNLPVTWARHEDLLVTHPGLVDAVLPLYGLEATHCLGCLVYPRYQLARRLDELPVPRTQALEFLSHRMLLRGARTAAILAGADQLTDQEALWQVVARGRQTWLFVGPNPYLASARRQEAP